MNSNIKNIGGDPNDKHYRYKRNVIEIEHLNKKGGTTKIKNMKTILKQLKVSDDFAIAFYKRIKKKGHGEISSGEFKGSLSVKELEKILDKMIVKFILCPKCKLPELDKKSCKACGYTDEKSCSDQEQREINLAPVSVAEMTKIQKFKGSNPVSIISSSLGKLYDRRLELSPKNRKAIDELINIGWKIPDIEEDALNYENSVNMFLLNLKN